MIIVLLKNTVANTIGTLLVFFFLPLLVLAWQSKQMLFLC